MLCTLIYRKVPEHTEYCNFVLYCIILEQECGVWSVIVDSCTTWYQTRQGIRRLGICFNIIYSEIFSLN